MILGGVDDDSLKAMDQLVDRRGHHQLQAVHGLPGRLLLRRRPDPAGHAEGPRQRRHDHDARRERHRHRRAGRSRPSRAARPTRSTTASPARRSWRREATNRAIWLAERGRRTARSTSCTCRRQRGARSRSPRPATPGRNVFAETCPQYLYLTLEDQLGAPGFEGAKWVCSTPLRTQARAPPRRPVAGPAHQRPRRRVHRPLPVLHEGPEGAGRRRLLQDPQRHRRRRAPRRPALPGRGRRQAVAGALGGDDRDHAGPDVRPLPAQGHHRARLRRRHRASTTRTAAPGSASRPTT